MSSSKTSKAAVAAATEAAEPAPAPADDVTATAGSETDSPPATSEEPVAVGVTVSEEWAPRVTKWYDMDNYGCPACAFDTLEIERYSQHIYTHHILPAAQAFREE